MLPFATKWMGHEDIVLSEGIHRKTNTLCFTYIWNLIKINQIISRLNWEQKECFKLVKKTRWRKYYVQSTFIIRSKLILLTPWQVSSWEMSLEGWVVGDRNNSLIQKAQETEKIAGSCLKTPSSWVWALFILKREGRYQTPPGSHQSAEGVGGFLPPATWSGCILWAKQRCLGLKLITQEAEFPETGHMCNLGLQATFL